MADAKVEKVTFELPFGKVTEEKVIDKKTGMLSSVTYRGAKKDLQDWEQKEFGITDEIRKNIADRNEKLCILGDKFLTERVCENLVPAKLVLGMGDGTPILEKEARSIKTYPVKDESTGLYNKTTSTKYGVLSFTDQRLLSQKVRAVAEESAKLVEDAFKKAEKK